MTVTLVGGRFESAKRLMTPQRRAYLHVLPQAQAIPEHTLKHNTLNAEVVTRAVLLKAEAIASLRAEVVAHLPRHDLVPFDELVIRAHALSHADVLHRSSTRRGPSLASELTFLRCPGRPPNTH